MQIETLAESGRKSISQSLPRSNAGHIGGAPDCVLAPVQAAGAPERHQSLLQPGKLTVHGQGQETVEGQAPMSVLGCVSCVINSQLLIQLAPRRVCFCFFSFPLKKINKLFMMSLIETKSELFITILWDWHFQHFFPLKLKLG